MLIHLSFSLPCPPNSDLPSPFLTPAIQLPISFQYMPGTLVPHKLLLLCLEFLPSSYPMAPSLNFSS